MNRSIYLLKVVQSNGNFSSAFLKGNKVVKEKLLLINISMQKKFGGRWLM